MGALSGPPPLPNAAGLRVLALFTAEDRTGRYAYTLDLFRIVGLNPTFGVDALSIYAILQAPTPPETWQDGWRARIPEALRAKWDTLDTEALAALYVMAELQEREAVL